MEADLNTRRGLVLRMRTAGFVYLLNAATLGGLLVLYLYHMGDFGWAQLIRSYFQLGFIAAWTPIVLMMCVSNAVLLLGSLDDPEHAHQELRTASGFAAWILVLDAGFVMVEIADFLLGRNVAPLFLLLFLGLHVYMIAELHLIRRRWPTAFALVRG